MQNNNNNFDRNDQEENFGGGLLEFPKININALQMSCYVLGAGAISFFLRWLQHQVAFDDNGLVGASVWNFILILFTCVSLYLAHDRISFYYERGYYIPESLGGVLHSSTRIAMILRIFFGLIMAAGGLILLLTCETYKSAGLLRIVSILGILTGICAPMLMHFADKDSYNPDIACLCGFVPILFFCVWLISTYKQNDINSVMWSYGVEIVTVCVCTIAFFRIAGFPFGVPRGRKTLFNCMFAAYMCFMSLADSRNIGMQIMIIATLMFMVLYVWLITQNFLYEQPEEEFYGVNDGGFEKLNSHKKKKKRF